MTDRPETMELREEIARALADADGLNWDEPCGIETEEGFCDSGTCISSHWEEHDTEQAKGWYLHLADAILPIITRERERAARAALEAAVRAHKVAAYDPAPFTKGEQAIRALSPADIVKGMK